MDRIQNKTIGVIHDQTLKIANEAINEGDLNNASIHALNLNMLVCTDQILQRLDSIARSLNNNQTHV